MAVFNVPLVAYISATVEASDPEEAIHAAVNGVWIQVGHGRGVEIAEESGPIDCIEEDKVWDQYEEDNDETD